MGAGLPAGTASERIPWEEAHIVHERVASSINDAVVVDGCFRGGANHYGMHAALDCVGRYCHNPVIGIDARLIASIEGRQSNACSGHINVVPAYHASFIWLESETHTTMEVLGLHDKAVSL